jgi:hypothetical protein
VGDFPAWALRTSHIRDLVHDDQGNAHHVTAFNEPEHLKAFGFDS